MDESRDPSFRRARIADDGLSVEAFDTIFDDHYDRIWRYLFRLGGRECADELAGEVFVQALAARDRFDPARGAVSSWLYGIASNLGRSWLRRRARGRRAVTRLAQWRRADADLAASDADGTARLDDRADAGRVMDALNHLRATDREILVLVAWEDLSYTEIADVLGLPIGTVRSRLSRARVRLRELAEVGDQVADEA